MHSLNDIYQFFFFLIYIYNAANTIDIGNNLFILVENRTCAYKWNGFTMVHVSCLVVSAETSKHFRLETTFAFDLRNFVPQTNLIRIQR